MKPIVSIFFDDRRLAKGRGFIKIRVTFHMDEGRWVRRYYGKSKCTPSEFKSFDNPRSDAMRTVKAEVMTLYAECVKHAGRHNHITPKEFDTLLNGTASDTLTGAFDKRVEELKASGDIGTCRVYKSAKASFVKFAGAEVIRFSEVDADWLRKYESWMTGRERSLNTIGINLRALRAIYNAGIRAREVSSEAYPFRNFKIRQEKRFKIPLTDAQLEAVKNYAHEDTERMKARDLWLFSYYGNGMNFMDLCSLRLKDIRGEFILFDRAKTRKTRQQLKKIVIPYEPALRAIVSRQGNKTLNPNAYLFPVLDEGLPALTIKNRVVTLIRDTNLQLRAIAKDLNIDRLTTVLARHTFANRMSNLGADHRTIQESLGHSNAQTTEHYLGSMDMSKIKKVREGL